MTVSEAAKRLRISRPTLSKLLNGRSRLTRSMAGKLRDAFGADAEHLLSMQEKVDQLAHRRSVADRPASHVPAFLSIKAADIARWAEDSISARTRLPVLLRRLVHSTGRNLTLVDFPGNDEGERRGNDGRVDAAGASPWVPKGSSWWEFGTDANPRKKAEKDYIARLKSVPERERLGGTFIFVTPRQWAAATTWANEKSLLGHWKAVRALDASSLEQWLETSAAGQTWLALELGLPDDGTETLESIWSSWSGACEPALHSKLFDSAVRDHLSGEGGIMDWLAAPPRNPKVISADSRGEALAFLHCLLAEADRTTMTDAEAGRFSDQAIVISDPATARKLSRTGMPKIVVAGTSDVEPELIQLHTDVHCILIRPRGPIDVKPDITLGLLSRDAFRNAMEAMGRTGDEANQLATTSGRSPTVLRRRLARPGIAPAGWSGQADLVRSLVPLSFAGAWHSHSSADRAALASLSATHDYETIERILTELATADETPVWQVGGYAGVVSRVDSLFAVRDYATKADIERFFELARAVLSEEDPALGLDEDQRLMAAFRGLNHEYSGALRNSVGEMLVVLAEHAGDLDFRGRLGIDVAAQVRMTVSSLLDPFTETTLLSRAPDLPLYAEAAPDVFLSALERDLESERPAVSALLEAGTRGLFGECPRSGLLWALEICSWRHLHRVAPILARLSTIEIDDQWSNTPFASLTSLFRSWMPQTAASSKERLETLRKLVKDNPDIGLKLCFELMPDNSTAAFANARPRYRADASGKGGIVTHGEIDECISAALQLILDHREHDEQSLVRLVQIVGSLSPRFHLPIWDLVDAWCAGGPPDEQQVALREVIRESVALHDIDRDERLGQVLESLSSDDPVIDNAWLFAEDFIRYLEIELEEQGLDDVDVSREIERRRAAFLHSLSRSSAGFESIIALILSSGVPYLIGKLLHDGNNSIDAPLFLATLLDDARHADTQNSRLNIDLAANGYLAACQAPEIIEVASAVLENASAETSARLFGAMPFQASTWNLLDTYDNTVQERYWANTTAAGWLDNDADASRACEKLLAVERPHTAFRYTCRRPKLVRTDHLVRVLDGMLSTPPESKNFLGQRYIGKIFESLSTRPDISIDELARLEFSWLSVLTSTSYGTPNLEAVIGKDPLLFVRMLALLYERSDEGRDPVDWWSGNGDTRESLRESAWSFFWKTRLLPGREADGNINQSDLSRWISRTRQLCRKFGREKVGDYKIGQLLSQVKRTETEEWPPTAICHVMQKFASHYMSEGFQVGVLNGRGVKVGEGGGIERNLAAGYQKDADRVKFIYPFVCTTLEKLAEQLRREAEDEDLAASARQRLG